ncbi:Cytochrome c7 [Candidatus Methanophagaceae archaeon]|nr:Cytochrome c7 [Methanophagales archaeon]
MESKKVALLAIAVVAVGIFALPSTVSLLSGQHTWYGLSAGPNDVPCEKCHQDIADEMISGDNGAHRNLTCSMCHRTLFNNYTYGSGQGDGSTPGKEAHAAAVIQCMDCHGILSDSGTWNHWSYPEYASCDKCHWSGGYPDFISAGGFGLGTTLDDTGERAAHKDFVNNSINESLMEGANEACIACHTRIGVNITWTKNTVLEFSAVEDDLGNWTLTDFQATGDNETNTNYKNNWTNSY